MRELMQRLLLLTLTLHLGLRLNLHRGVHLCRLCLSLDLRWCLDLLRVRLVR